MFSQTTYTVASSDGHKNNNNNNNNNKNNLDIDVYVRPSPYNRVFEEEGLGHNGTVTATRGKNTRRRSTSMSSQTAYTVALSGGHKKIIT